MGVGTDLVLRNIDKARLALYEAKTMQEAKQIMDMAGAAEVYAKRQGLSQEAIDYAHSIKIEALMRLGQIRAATPKAVGSDRGGRPALDGTRALPSNPPPTLAELGLSKKTSTIAQQLAALPPEQFEQVRSGTATITQALREVVHERRPRPAPPVGRFSVIYADPPWRYDFAETETRAVENQYPTMTTEEIVGLRVPAADDAVLFLWATAPRLREALAVMEAWGFEYKTHAVWDKQKIGMGYWFRGRHELLLVGTRGTPGAPDPENRAPSVIVAARGEHSEKPKEVYDLIERMCPGRSRIELFARAVREGWERWGNEPA